MNAIEIMIGNHFKARHICVCGRGNTRLFLVFVLAPHPMPQITISSATKPPTFARGFPLTIDVTPDSTVADVKAAIAVKFPKVCSLASLAPYTLETAGWFFRLNSPLRNFFSLASIKMPGVNDNVFSSFLRDKGSR